MRTIINSLDRVGFEPETLKDDLFTVHIEF